MTICIGLRATDGLVIAADTEETDSYFKRTQRKIVSFIGSTNLGATPPTQLVCALTGAGDSGYLDAFFIHALRDIPYVANQIELLDFLENKVKLFHERHIFPLASPTHAPEIDVLIGAICQYQPIVFVTHGSTVREASLHAAVGAGAHFALSIINDVVRIADIKRTELLAAYVIGLTKEHIEHCGKNTSIVSLHSSTIARPEGQPASLVSPPQALTYVPFEKIRQWEDSFRKKWATRQVELIEELIEEELTN
jgi:hypothetical protein